MGNKIDYKKFLKDLDARLDLYFNEQAEFICCKKGCSYCCQEGDYPISEIELHYLMEGYALLDNELKKIIQSNFKIFKPGGCCPFLVNNICSIYTHRPIICRVHGLAYLYNKSHVKIPYCVNFGKNYSKSYKGNKINSEPIKENLDTHILLKDFKFGEIRNLYDWFNK